MQLVEMEVSFGELFSAISELEGHEFVENEEYLQKHEIQILDENNKWCNVPALIKKASSTRTLKWSDGSILECADKHWIRTIDNKCTFAKNIKKGHNITKANGDIISCVSNLPKLDNELVFDLQIDSKNHLYQTSNGIVHHNTLLAKSISRMLDVPFAVADATSLTEAGYVGDDVENIIVKLLQSADGDVEKAERGIIYIDEVDKLARRGDSASITRDVGGEGVQQAILKILEGTTCRVPPGGGRKHPNQEMVEIDTTNILFLLGGAFVGLDKIVEERSSEKGSIGFGATIAEVKEEGASLTHRLGEVQTRDLHKFGLIPELVGRIPVKAALTELTNEELVRVLTEPKNALTKQFIKLFSLEDIELEFTSDGLETIADQCIEDRTGARGLRSIFESILLDVQYELPDLKESGVTKIIINKDVVDGKQKPLMLYKNKDNEQAPTM